MIALIPYAPSPWNALGRRRGRPCRPPQGGMASSISNANSASGWLAGPVRTTSGMPSASVTMWRLQPFLPRSVGFGPVCAPLQRPHRGAVDHRTFEVDPASPAEHAQQPPVQFGPDPQLRPGVEPPPAGAAAAVSQPGRQHLPGHAGLEHEDDPLQAGAVGDRRPSPFGGRLVLGAVTARSLSTTPP